MKRILITILLAIFVMAGGLLIFKQPPSESIPAPAADSSPSGIASTTAAISASPSPTPGFLPEDLSSIQVSSDTMPLNTIPESITALVNRTYLLPSDYIPSDLTEPKVQFSFDYPDDKRKLRRPAARALEKMFRAAAKKKIQLYGVSGYRSYARQKQIYDRNVSLYGHATTDTVSAKPGSSEHQTGLTIDISARSVNFLLDKNFANTREGKWVAKNAHKYGYIIRYPDGKSEITGYRYEPWHIRYVGVTVATYLHKHKLTLEEFYGVAKSKDEKTGIDVEEPGKVKHDSVSGSAISGRKKKKKSR